MKKESMESRAPFLSAPGGRFRAAMAAVFLLGLVFASFPAAAQCETPAAGTTALRNLADQSVDAINKFIKSVQDGASTSFTVEIVQISMIVNDFEDVVKWLGGWWDDMLFPVKKAMMRELHVAVDDQTSSLGRFMDAQVYIEENYRRRAAIIEGRRRYMPSTDLACEIDAKKFAGWKQTESLLRATALSGALARDSVNRRLNMKGFAVKVDGTSYYPAPGKGADIKAVWEEYRTKFCNGDLGDAGCQGSGRMAGAHADFPALLWGRDQGLEMSNPDNLTKIQAALRYLIHPLAPDPIAPSAVKDNRASATSTSAQRAMMQRRADAAFVNTIYNTLGQMVSERARGKNKPSYREIQEELTRDRFTDPNYVIKMTGDPVLVGREQPVLNTLRLQVMNDIFRRSEELLFMQAAEYSRDLYGSMPRAAIPETPLTKP